MIYITQIITIIIQSENNPNFEDLMYISVVAFACIEAVNLKLSSCYR